MKTVAISILGTTLDKRGTKRNRWDKWRPTVSMCQQDDMIIDRLELLFDANAQSLADAVTEDIEHISPETVVNHHHIDFSSPWDFESVYSALLDFSRAYPFKPNKENYLTHITTGTHVAQICLYLLTEAHYLPGRLLQTSPPSRNQGTAGHYQIIDLDLTKYDEIASRYKREHDEGTNYLKGGISTNSKTFNRMIEQLEQVSLRSNDPILLMGPTGAGKSQLARRVYTLRQQRGRLSGALVTVNCATLRGDNAMSTLFGHKKGAFTGAMSDRPGLLRQADGGLLFLDEVGELGLDEQAMLLRAIEDKTFMPLGSDKEVTSDFQIIAGTNKDLNAHVNHGSFREDLLARLDLWSYTLPSLQERLEDLEPNIAYELDKFATKSNSHVSFNHAAKAKFLRFGQSEQAIWSGNFRDLNASITRMATLASGGRINTQNVDDEIIRLNHKWHPQPSRHDTNAAEQLKQYLPKSTLDKMDYYEQEKLAIVVRTCQNSQSMAEAGRRLFNRSRDTKASPNDSHRVRQILTRYKLMFAELKPELR